MIENKASVEPQSTRDENCDCDIEAREADQSMNSRNGDA